MGGAIKCTLNAIFDWNDFWSPVVICFSFPFAFLFPSARKERDWDRRAVQTVLVTPITVFGVPFLIWAKVLLHLSACCIYLAFPYSTFLLVVDFILVPSSHDCDVDWETIQGDRERRGESDGDNEDLIAITFYSSACSLLDGQRQEAWPSRAVARSLLLQSIPNRHGHSSCNSFFFL